MARTAVIYARISKDDRGDRLGVDRQEKLCRELAERQGVDVIDVLVDNDVSAYRGKGRPQFERLVGILGDGGVDAVLAYHPDRLYRRGTDLERLVGIVEHGKIQVHTVAAGDVDLSSATGRMVARIVGSIAQGESERTGERLRAKSDELAARGRPPGGRPPYGYQWGQVPDGRGGTQNGYVVNPDEARALQVMADRVLAGASLLRVARELDAEGISTREGRRWHHSSVRAALVNPAVAGLRVHRREVAGPGDWEAVLDRPTWEEIRAVLADPARKRKRPARRYLLTGVMETVNGDPMIGRPDRGRDGALDRRTYATRTPCTASMSIGADELEAVVVEALLQRLDNAAVPTPASPEAREVEEIESLEAELAELAELRGQGSISLAEWLAARGPLQARIDDARRAAASVRRPLATAPLLAARGAVRGAWPNLDFAKQREIVGAVVERVVVGPATRGRWTPVEDRLTVRWRV
jgi:site-specific DNA recombinase